MRVVRNPIMAGLLAASLPLLPCAAPAAERGQVIDDDPAGNRQVILDFGDSVTHAGAGAAIDVTTGGNAVQGDGIRVTAGSAFQAATLGIRAREGGAAFLARSTISTLGDGQAAHALFADGAGSAITLHDSLVDTRGQSSSGAYARAGGRINITGGAITTTGLSSSALWTEGAGSVITANNVAVSTRASNASGAYAALGGRMVVMDGSITTTGGDAPGVVVNGDGSLVSLARTRVRADAGIGAWLTGGRLVMDGGNLTGASAVSLGAPTSPGMAPASVKISNATLTATAPHGYGVNVNAPGTSAVLDHVSIKALAVQGHGVWLASTGTLFVVTVFDISSRQTGVDTRAGQVVLTDGSVTTLADHAHGLSASREYGDQASIRALRVDIETRGDAAAGAEVRLGGSNITLQDSRIATRGKAAHGLRAADAGATLLVRNSLVNTTGAGAIGLVVVDNAAATLDHSRLIINGDGAHGVWSYERTPGPGNVITIANGSQISTRDGAGLLTVGGNHVFRVSDSDITARAGGNADRGVLLRAEARTPTTGSGRITLDATRSLLVGDVFAQHGNIDISLKDGTILTGAVTQRAGHGTVDLAVDATSVWHVRGTSTLGTLANAGTVVLAAPGASASIPTLTVRHYQGDGVLVLRQRPDDAPSGNDRLVIDGGTASGSTALRILNNDAQGRQAPHGITLVQTINGGTTTPDAFRLDAGSTGYRATSDTLALNGYDYRLVRDDDGGSQWYLTTGNAAPDELDPAAASSRNRRLTSRQPAFQNVSPESGAYAGNRLASTRFFTHAVHDRVPAPSAADIAHSDALEGDNPAAAARGRLWTRVQGRQDSGLRLSQGRVDIATDSAIVQLGGDVITTPLGQDGVVYAGLMGGYGNARSRATSTLVRSSGATVQARADGQVSGYSAGLYGTAYQHSASRLGAYADTWLQVGRYTNTLSSELGSARYRSTVWSASIEVGYAIAPFAPGSALGPIVLEPHAQLVYSHYRAQDAILQGTRMRSGNDNAWDSRIGVRLYPQATANALAVRPFLEANWLHSFRNPSVNMGPNSLDASLARNSLELKLGAEGRVSRAVQLSGHVFGQAGNNNQHGYGGMVNVGYHW